MTVTVRNLLVAFGWATTESELANAESSQQIDLAGNGRLWLGADLDDEATWATLIRYGKRIKRFKSGVEAVGRTHG